MLNQELLVTQKVTTEQQEKLFELYDELENIFECTRNMSEEEVLKLGYSITISVKNIEYQLQENWNFPQDENFHSWWYKVPKCSCAKMDNAESIGYRKYVNCGCLIHGHLCKGEE